MSLVFCFDKIWFSAENFIKYGFKPNLFAVPVLHLNFLQHFRILDLKCRKGNSTLWCLMASEKCVENWILNFSNQNDFSMLGKYSLIFHYNLLMNWSTFSLPSSFSFSMKYDIVKIMKKLFSQVWEAEFSLLWHPTS